MKGDTYYLKNDDGYITHKFVVEDDDFHLVGTCYEAYSWHVDNTPYEYSYIAGVYCKWDACTHWYFHGEDYDPEIEDSDCDSYYHLCGGYTFLNHIKAMCFVWKLAEQILVKDPHTLRTDNATYIHDEYYEPEKLVKLMEVVLDGYEILKANLD